MTDFGLNVTQLFSPSALGGADEKIKTIAKGDPPMAESFELQ